MNIEDLHNNDDLYRKAHERLEEEPSPEVWNNVMAKLDNRDAQYYQQKSIRWKRTSLLLLLLLGTVLLTGILYIGAKKEAPQFVGTNKNDKHITPDNRTLQLPVSNDSNVINQNINQQNVYATEQSGKSHSDTGAPTLPSTRTEQLAEVFKQNDARSGKQYSQMVQDTSVVKKVVATPQDASIKRDNYSRKKLVLKHVLAQKNIIYPGKEEGVGYLQDNAAKKQAIISSSTVKKKNTFNQNSKQLSAYQPKDVVDESDMSLTLRALNVNSFSLQNIDSKDAVDSNTVAQVNTMAAATIKKEVSVKDVAVSKNKKTVKIAQPFKQRMQLTGYSSLDFSEYHLDDDEHENNNQQPPSRREDKHKIGDRENHGFSFSAGITARFQATRKFSIKSGLSYSNTTININPQTLYAAQDGNQGVAYKFITSSGYAYVKPSINTPLTVGDSAKADQSQHQLQFLSIPVMVGYTAYTSKHFSIIPSFGASANFLLGTQVKTEINEPSAKESITITNLNGLQPWYPSLLADAEVQYHLKKNMSFTFLPSFRYAISPLTQNNAVKTSPYSFGMGLGFTYQF